ncbi:site-2 protease family protein [Candidatus Gracilibacteria bacterium]|nr:site-2 protease family protein [Candidatus Gracilibacteria bacterium]
MIFLGILVSLIIFSILVLVHEYGHYKTARIFGIHVEEFGLGIPPRAKKLWKNKSGTLFSLNWIPLGGFVKITGESELYFNIFDKKGARIGQNEIKSALETGRDIFDKKGQELKKSEKKYLLEFLKNQRPGENFFEKNIWQKSLVLLAGVIMNIFAAYIIFVGIFLVGAQPIGVNTIIPTQQTSYVLPSFEQAIENGILKEEPGILLYPIEESIAFQSGIRDGDRVISIDGLEFENIESLQEYISSFPLTPIAFGVERDGEYIDLVVTPSSEGKIGSYLAPNIVRNEDFKYNFGFLESLKVAGEETIAQLELGTRGIYMILRKLIFPEVPEERSEAIEYVAGPIGIVQVVTLSLSSGLMLLSVLAAVISINLALFNLLPIPALDGGRLLLLWIRTGLERIVGKNTKLIGIENMVHVIFFILLIALSLLIAYNDIIRIIGD